MNTILDIIEQYSVKEDRKIKKICAPLSSLGISYLWYYFIEADGKFGGLSNDIEYANYYFNSKLHLNVPYYIHPSNFKSGYAFLPGAFADNYQIIVQGKFNVDHLFLILKAQENRVDGFAFYNRNLSLKSLPNYLENIELLERFIRYFKRETASYIREQSHSAFNIQKERGQEFFSLDPSLALVKHSAKDRIFLKEIYGLSPQEERCLELLKQGYTAQATGSILNISPRTVETYINNIKIKLKCNSKLELINY